MSHLENPHTTSPDTPTSCVDHSANDHEYIPENDEQTHDAILNLQTTLESTSDSEVQSGLQEAQRKFEVRIASIENTAHLEFVKGLFMSAIASTPLAIKSGTSLQAATIAASGITLSSLTAYSIMHIRKSLQ